MCPDLFWIPGPWPGRLAVSTRPRGGDWLDADAAGWRSAGIDVVVSLLEPVEADQLELRAESKAVESEGIRFISFPIPDREVPASTRNALALLVELATALDQGKNIAVHCRQGLGRSGIIAAGLLVVSGSSADKAIEVVSTSRGHQVPETVEQRRWLEQLAAQHPALAS